MTDYAYVTLAPLPVFAGYTDDFPGTALGPFWSQLPSQAASSAVASSVYAVALSGSGNPEWAGIRNAEPLSLVDANVSVGLSPGDAANSSKPVFAGLQLCSSVPPGDPTYTVPWVRLAALQGELWCGWGTDSAGTVQFSTAYSAVNHKFLRFSQDGGNLSWDVSPDGASWTSLHSTAVGSLPLQDFASVYVQLLQYTWGADASTCQFTDFAYSGNLDLEVQVTATIFASTLTTYKVVIPVTSGDTIFDIQDNAVAAIKSASGVSALKVVFL